MVGKHEPNAADDREFVTKVQLHHDVRPGARFLVDYDYGVGKKAELGPRDMISRAIARPWRDISRS